MFRLSLCLLVALAFMASCDESVALDAYRNVSGNSWSRGDTIVFSTDTIARQGVYGESVGIRLSADYPFSNLSLIVEQTVSPRDTARIDTLLCSFTDKRGRPGGTGISYRLYEFPMAAIRLDEGDSLRVKIRHDMRRETLPGIADVGFRVSSSPRPVFPIYAFW